MFAQSDLTPEAIGKTLGIHPVITLALIGIGYAVGYFLIERNRKKLANEQATFQANLTRKNEHDLTEFKHKLELTATERSIKLTKVFQDQADIIAGTYKKLVEYRRAIHHLLGTSAPEGEKVNQETLAVVRQKREVFIEYFEPIIIYLPPETAAQCWQYWHHLYAVSVTHIESKATSGSAQESRDEMWKFIDQSKTVMELLEKDFRNILGLATVDKLINSHEAR